MLITDNAKTRETNEITERAEEFVVVTDVVTGLINTDAVILVDVRLTETLELLKDAEEAKVEVEDGPKVKTVAIPVLPVLLLLLVLSFPGSRADTTAATILDSPDCITVEKGGSKVS